MNGEDNRFWRALYRPGNVRDVGPEFGTGFTVADPWPGKIRPDLIWRDAVPQGADLDHRDVPKLKRLAEKQDLQLKDEHVASSAHRRLLRLTYLVTSISAADRYLLRGWDLGRHTQVGIRTEVLLALFETLVSGGRINPRRLHAWSGTQKRPFLPVTLSPRGLVYWIFHPTVERVRQAIPLALEVRNFLLNPCPPPAHRGVQTFHLSPYWKKVIMEVAAYAHLQEAGELLERSRHRSAGQEIQRILEHFTLVEAGQFSSWIQEHPGQTGSQVCQFVHRRG